MRWPKAAQELLQHSASPGNQLQGTKGAEAVSSRSSAGELVTGAECEDLWETVQVKKKGFSAGQFRVGPSLGHCSAVQAAALTAQETGLEVWQARHWETLLEPCWCSCPAQEMFSSQSSGCWCAVELASRALVTVGIYGKAEGAAVIKVTFKVNLFAFVSFQREKCEQFFSLSYFSGKALLL